jgi:hypothetical protein
MQDNTNISTRTHIHAPDGVPNRYASIAAFEVNKGPRQRGHWEMLRRITLEHNGDFPCKTKSYPCTRLIEQYGKKTYVGTYVGV